jgi:hypothetical protein
MTGLTSCHFTISISIMKYLIIIMILFSCQAKQDSDQNLLEFPKTRTLSGERSQISDQIFQAFDLVSIGEKLIVSSKDPEFLFQVFDIKSGKKINSFGKIGEGPCEFEFPTSIQLDGTNKELGLFNRRRWIYQTIDPNTFECISSPSSPLDFNFQKALALNDSTFFGIGIFKNKYATYNPNSKETNILTIPYPFVEQKLDVNPKIAMNQQGDLHLNPDGTRILVTSIYSPFYDIIDSKSLSLIKRSEGWAPSTMTTDDPNVLTTSIKEDNRFGYISSSVTEKNIYLLFSGKKFSEGPYSSSIVHVLDWEGNKIEQLNLDIEVESIAVTEDNQTLLAYYDDGKANILTFKLN